MWMSDTAEVIKNGEKCGLFSSPVLRQSEHLSKHPSCLFKKKKHQIQQNKCFQLEVLQTFRTIWTILSTTGLIADRIKIFELCCCRQYSARKPELWKGLLLLFLLGILLALCFSLFLMLIVVTNSLFRICLKLFIMSNHTKMKSKCVQRSRWHQLLQIHWNRSVNRK